MGWCDEAGEHTQHRKYVGSRPVWAGKWLMGVNVIELSGRKRIVELTLTPKGDAPSVVLLQPDDAILVGQMLNKANKQVARSSA